LPVDAHRVALSAGQLLRESLLGLKENNAASRNNVTTCA
jgi:hypothetical protein